MASERQLSQVEYLNSRAEALVQIHYMFFVRVFRSLPVGHNLYVDRWLLVLFECEHGRRFLYSRQLALLCTSLSWQFYPHSDAVTAVDFNEKKYRVEQRDGQENHKADPVHLRDWHAMLGGGFSRPHCLLARRLQFRSHLRVRLLVFWAGFTVAELDLFAE
jgi:hypothetical protein